MKKAVSLIMAAGTGSRMGYEQNKLFLDLQGKSIICHTLEKFLILPEIVDIYLIINPKDEDEMTKEVEKFSQAEQSRIHIVFGGETRQDSVINGLEATKQNLDKETCIPKSDIACIIHDGARPLIESGHIQECIQKIYKYGCGVGIGIPVNDTIHQIDEQYNLVNILERSKLIAIQTPQGALFSQLLEAHRLAKANNFRTTDDLSVLRYAEINVKISLGSENNIKITQVKDILLAESILANTNT